jgi:glycerate-2-kinase
VGGFPWGPTVPDTTTFADAVSILKKHDLLEKVPDSIRNHLVKAKLEQETPKFEDFKREGIDVYNLVLAESETVCKAAKERAEELGFNAMILSTLIEGESREVGTASAGIAKDVERNGRPLAPPSVIIMGGETTVTIVGKPGEGGRNQEFVLAASLKIKGSAKIVIASIGTDGTDGPTDIAGGIVDGHTLERAGEKGLDIFENLKKHNSSYVLRVLEDAIFTGPTGTNVMDLRIIVVK